MIFTIYISFHSISFYSLTKQQNNTILINKHTLSAQTIISSVPTIAMPLSSNNCSVGKNSNVSLCVNGGDCDVDDDDEEVQSEYKGGPLDNFHALEQVLPFKKSISDFYSGKSESVTSLSNAASRPSIEEIRKPENVYTRKRKNLLAFTRFWDKNRGSGSSHGISKRTAYSRSMISLEATKKSSESTSGETSICNSSSPGCCLPPLPPQARMTVQKEQSSHSSCTGLSMNISKE